MTNDDLDRLKLELECEKFRLMSFQLDNLLEEYDKLIELRQSIQLKFFTTLENVKKNGIPVKQDYERWEKIRTSERDGWNEEIDLIADLKYDVDDNLKILDNTKMRRILIDSELEE
ncbi:MAG: hypothetical protein J6B73_05780 [Methanobrevibacter sp.]|uniref:Uncharacterized protein n=1 Tax=Methanobrevibacter millerae TaxID=230361 RepID=A0A8T3VS93_9EURY|nr:hypothetical protein [Methanobrevibacter sp.]MBE6510825.1 hypothetical protein [Methanobrevibacter millerae]MBO5151656.1 hypothetical protein [Methanobrevibacter sp.]